MGSIRMHLIAFELIDLIGDDEDNTQNSRKTKSSWYKNTFAETD
jgi:hypothetical protein